MDVEAFSIQVKPTRVRNDSASIFTGLLTTQIAELVARETELPRDTTAAIMAEYPKDSIERARTWLKVQHDITARWRRGRSDVVCPRESYHSWTAS